MDYSTAVGQEVLYRDGRKGTITKDREDGTKETVLRLTGTPQEARYLFGHVIKEQAKVFRHGGGKWRVVRLFDAKTGEQLAQES